VSSFWQHTVEGVPQVVTQFKEMEQFVAKSPEKPEKEEESAAQAPAPERAPAVPEAPAQQMPPQAARVQVQIDDTKALANYSNFCRVTGTPEELIIDFGLNPQPIGIPTQPIVISQRIITNFYTAKRMLNALQMTVARHEATFGVLEIDVQKRVRTGFGPPPGAGR
jgi:hypothetical protein